MTSIKYRRRFPAHLRWVRRHRCEACDRQDNIVAHHVRLQSDGGMGIKPSDFFALPLCSECHRELHDHGEKRFENNSMYRWKNGMREKALWFAEGSPEHPQMKQSMDTFTISVSVAPSREPDPQTTK